MKKRVFDMEVWVKECHGEAMLFICADLDGKPYKVACPFDMKKFEEIKEEFTESIMETAGEIVSREIEEMTEKNEEKSHSRRSSGGRGRMRMARTGGFKY